MTISTCPVAIVGAGPYGLASAAHLRSANVEIRIFGEPMEFWRRMMPTGMFLRSSWEASHISDPHGIFTLDKYQAVHSTQLSSPVPLDGFIGYALWFQRQVVPDVDPRRVTRIEPVPEGFRLLLEDGESFYTRHVVVAAGIDRFAYFPPQFVNLPRFLVSHSSEHSNFRCFAGQRVIVIGGGQSALESAALLHESEADVEVFIRASKIHWLGRGAWLRKQSRPIRHLFYPPTDVGPPILNQIVARPDLFRLLPRELQHRIAYRSIRPAGADWLRPRLKGVPITTGRVVLSALPVGKELYLTLNDGTVRCVDHILLATGYRVDVSRYDFFTPDLVRSLELAEGYPRLSLGFESSVAGLHFLGAAAAWSFGPVMRFVSGTKYAARMLTRYIVTRL